MLRMKLYRYTILLLFVVQSMWVFGQEGQETTDLVDTETVTDTTTEETASDTFIETAQEVLARTAHAYGEITDFKSNIIINNANEPQSRGLLFVKEPNNMRINFTTPKGQVINNNGKEFIYIYP